MARTETQKADVIDGTVLVAASRLRLRALALLEGALKASGIPKATLASRLGVRRTAVQHTFDGNGNMTLQTLAEYLGALDIELELVPVARGEISRSMRERRAPEVCALTMRDHDWTSSALAVAEARPRTAEIWGSPSPHRALPAPTESAGARGAVVKVGRRS